MSRMALGTWTLADAGDINRIGYSRRNKEYERMFFLHSKNLVEKCHPAIHYTADWAEITYYTLCMEDLPCAIRGNNNVVFKAIARQASSVCPLQTYHQSCDEVTELM